MRRRKRTLTQRVNGNLTLRFTAPGLTSYSGLELFRRFLRETDFAALVRTHLRRCNPEGDYSSVAMIRLILAMLIVGGRRLRHVRYLAHDPIVKRLCGLACLPSERTLSRWLSRCRRRVRAALLALNFDIVALGIRELRLPRLTVDVDGTVLSTGLLVEGAFRGFNPHRRKVPSYYPITACLAQTGHLLSVKNRPGNIHDGKASMPFLRDLFRSLRDLAGSAVVEIRLDGAFFRQEIVRWLEPRAEYAIKVPFYRWTGLRTLTRRRRRWISIGPDLQAFETRLWLKTWARELHVVLYRKRVHHETAKNFQLDLFDPDDGIWEYSAITTNKTLSPRALWHFMAGRGLHEKIIGELKSGYAFDSIPTQSYAANTAWQLLSVLAHNLIVNLQLAVGACTRKRTWKRTTLFRIQSVQTLRYELLNKAGLLQRPDGRPTLTLAPNPQTQNLFQRWLARLAPAA
jgi:hypothetical protein